MNSPWIGIIHDPPETQKFDRSKNIFKNSRFVSSLKHCKHLFTMSDASTQWAIKNLSDKGSGYINIKVDTLRHPLPDMNSQFDMKKYESNKEKSIIQIGNWLRKTYAIYFLKLPDSQTLPYKFTKKICPWSNRMSQELQQSCSRDKVKVSPHTKASVKHLQKLSDADYTKMFEANIIFLELYASTVNNVVLEAIKANTPILINRLSSVEEYLGKDYPLLYDDREQIGILLSDESNIVKAHEYLSNMDKSVLSLDYFTESIKKFLR